MKTRILIPAVLAATVLIAGVFALMPVQEATTVHTEIGVLTVASADAQALTNVDIVADSANVKVGTVCAAVDDNDNNNDPNTYKLRVEVSPDGTDVNDLDGEAETADCFLFVGHRVFIANTVAVDNGDTVGYSVAFKSRAP